MNITARSRILPHMILTVFFCALAVAATTRPLSRVRLGVEPQLSQEHQGLERHTFFEVSAGGVYSQTLYDLLARTDLYLLAAEAQRQASRAVAFRQSANWPVVFSPVYRHIPPPRSGDSDPSA